LFQATKRALAAARPRLVVTSAGETDLFDVSLVLTHSPRWPNANVEIRAWPITQQAERALALGEHVVFPRLSYAGLTPLIAFGITAQVGKAKGQSVFVMNLPLDGAPEDRQDRVLRSLIESRDQLLRYILFLLASGDESAVSSGELAGLLKNAGSGVEDTLPLPCLLETMLRALHRGPAQLQRVESLLDVLRKGPDASELLSADFQAIWEPIWKVAREAKAK
jgi:hypothetical protein